MRSEEKILLTENIQIKIICGFLIAIWSIGIARQLIFVKTVNSIDFSLKSLFVAIAQNTLHGSKLSFFYAKNH